MAFGSRHAQTVCNRAYCHKIDYVAQVKDNLNVKGHPSCFLCFKVKAIVLNRSARSLQSRVVFILLSLDLCLCYGGKRLNIICDIKNYLHLKYEEKKLQQTKPWQTWQQSIVAGPCLAGLLPE